MDGAAGREFRRVAAGDQVDRHHVGDERDVGVGGGGLLQRLLDRPAGGIGDMDDAAVAVPAFLGQMPAIRVVARC